jgi:hypothetical protein
MASLILAINAITALIGVIDELERRGSTLTEEMRRTRSDQRQTLNSLWADYLARRRAGEGS